MSERTLHKSVCDYIRLNYPHALFHFDLAGLNLSKAQPGMTKGIKRAERGWADLIICAPSKSGKYKALLIKVKAGGIKLFNKSGELKTDHLVRQTDMKLRFESRGYYADFAVGLDACIKLIENYFNVL